MQISRNNQGFTLIELIVVVCIVSVLTSGILVLYSLIRYQDPIKSANQLDQMLEKVRLETMSKGQRKYLYIYRIDGTTFIKVSEAMDANLADLDRVSGTKLGRRIHLSYKRGDSTEKELNDTENICIFFTKSSGAFGVDFEFLKLSSGNKSSTIRCYIDTGRRLIN